MMARHAQKQAVEGLPALGIERLEHLLVDPLDGLAEGRELPAAARSQADEVAPAVLRVARALHEAPLLQRIEEADELAAIDAEGIGDRRLGLRSEERRVGKECRCGWGPSQCKS